MHLRLFEIGQGEVTLSKWAPFLFCGTAWCIVTKSKKHATSCTMEDDHSKDSSSYHQIGMSIQGYKGTKTHYVTTPLAVEHADLKRCRFHLNIQLCHILGNTTSNFNKTVSVIILNYPSLLFILQNLRLALLFWCHCLFLDSRFLITLLWHNLFQSCIFIKKELAACQKSTSKVLKIKINNKTTGTVLQRCKHVYTNKIENKAS